MQFENSIDLKVLFKEELSSDVKFIVEDRNAIEQTIHAHKYILRAQSSVFRQMFYGDLQEGDSIVIKDVSAEAFTEFLQHFYLTEIHLTAENFPEVLKLADKYDTLTLRSICEQFMEKMVTLDTMCLYYELALLHDLSMELIGKLRDFISRNFSIAWKLGFNGHFASSVLKCLLTSDSTIVREIDIFRKTITWAETSLKNRNEAVTNEKLLEEIGDYLKLIRFPTMSATEFLNCIENHPWLMTREDYFDILNYILANRPLTVAKRFSTELRQSDTISIDFDRYDKPYFATGDDFFFEMKTTKKYFIRIGISSVRSRPAKCTISIKDAQHIVIHKEQFGDADTFSLSKQLEFEAGKEYTVGLESSDKILVCHNSRADDNVSMKYRNGYNGTVISKIEFTEAFDQSVLKYFEKF